MRQRRARTGAALRLAVPPLAVPPSVALPLAAPPLAALSLAAVSLVVLPLAVLLSACAKSDVDRAQLETQVQRSLESRATPRLEVKQVSCPDRLKAEKGAQTHCSITTMAGRTVTALVTVTGTANSRLQFDLKLDQNPS